METSDASRTQSASTADTQQELLQYYRSVCERYDDHRQEMMDRVSNLEVQHEELHQLQWKLKTQQDEIVLLQRALSQANDRLFEQRSMVLKLHAENEQLKLQEVEDRRRIQHLLAVTQPTTQEVTFFRDCRPEKQYAAQTKGRSDANTTRGDGSRMAVERVLKTVYVPSGNGEALMKKLDIIQEQLRQKEAMYEDRIRALMQEKIKSEQIRSDESEKYQQYIEQLQKQLADQRSLNRKAMNREISIERSGNRELRQVREEASKLRQKCEQLQTDLNRVTTAARAEVEAVQDSTSDELHKMSEEIRRLRDQRSDDLTVLQEQYVKVQQEFAKKNAEKSEKLDQMCQKFRKLQKRRVFEMEGYTNDIVHLRRALRQLETAWAANIALGNPQDTTTQHSDGAIGPIENIPLVFRPSDGSIPNGYIKTLQSLNSLNGKNPQFVGKTYAEDLRTDAVLQPAWSSKRLNEEIKQLTNRVQMMQTEAQVRSSLPIKTINS